MKTIFSLLLLVGSLAAFMQSGLPAPDPTGTMAIRQMETPEGDTLRQNGLIADPTGTLSLRQTKTGVANP